MSTGILDDAVIELDGVPMRASADALRHFPVAVRCCRRTEGFLYDDGTRREWFAHVPGGRHSSYTFVFDDGTGPKVLPETAALESAVDSWINGCHNARALPVMTLLDDGTVLLGEEDI